MILSVQIASSLVLNRKIEKSFILNLANTKEPFYQVFFHLRSKSCLILPLNYENRTDYFEFVFDKRAINKRLIKLPEKFLRAFLLSLFAFKSRLISPWNGENHTDYSEFISDK